MIASEKIDLYDWFEIQAKLCEVMGIDEDNFRGYHKVVGGEYKDFWHVCLETIVPDNMNNDTIDKMFSTKPEWFEGDAAWKNLVLKAWNTVYESLTGPNDPGLYVRFSW